MPEIIYKFIYMCVCALDRYVLIIPRMSGRMPEKMLERMPGKMWVYISNLMPYMKMYVSGAMPGITSENMLVG